MIEIDGILLEKDILTNYFLCDITKCLGGCCTFYGEYGAPLQPDEVPILENHIEITDHLLSQKSKNWIKENGVAEHIVDKPTTVCIENKDCVFVYYDKKNDAKIALCAIEKCFFEGKTKYRKPISCWLYPLRVATYKDTTYLYYSKIPECQAAIKNGKTQNVKLYQALKEPLIAWKGIEWYNKLVSKAESL